MDHITELFCILDDFCKTFNESLEKALISDQKSKLKKKNNYFVEEDRSKP